MKRFFILILLFAAGYSSKAQNTENIVYDENAEVRTVPAFTGIEVSGAVSVYLSQGSTPGVAVSAGEAKYNEKIHTEVKNGVLHISVDGGIWNGFNWTNKKLKAYVTATDVNSLDVSGASYVSVSGSIKTDELKLDVSGASEIKGAIDVNKLKIDISGASVVRLTGKAKEASIDGSGASKVSSYDLVIDNCKASTSGASNIRVTVNSEINADASGGSTIWYKGSGVAKMISSSAGASIKNRSGNDD